VSLLGKTTSIQVEEEKEIAGSVFLNISTLHITEETSQLI
jgi:nucleoid-associated protein YejK